MLFFKYEIEFYDEINEKSRTARGICTNESIGSAVERIENFYGDLEKLTISYVCSEFGLEQDILDDYSFPNLVEGLFKDTE